MTYTRHRQIRAAARRGAAAVEMAIVLPVLLIMLLGIIEIARAVMVSNALTTAAREGVRSGVVPNGDNAKITAAVIASLVQLGFSTTNVATVVEVNGTAAEVAAAATGDAITVEVSMPYDDVKWLPVPTYLGGSRVLTARSVMRRE